MKTLPLFTIRRPKPRLREPWTFDRHPYVADLTGLACVHCCLPRGNRRHEVQA